MNPTQEKKDDAKELLPLVNDRGVVIGVASRGECHRGTMLLHPVVHLHVFDTDGRLFLQHRPKWKDIQPDRWDTAVGGHVAWCENVLQALRREAYEELGLEDFKPEFLERYVFRSEREEELVNVFRTTISYSPTPSEELDGGRFFTEAEIRVQIGQDYFTPNFEKEWLRIFGKQE